MTKQVGVVVVTYNSAATIERALVSINAAPEVGTIVVVDNASADDTLACIEGQRVVTLPQKRNLGFGSACNLGSERVIEPYIAFVNPDAVASPGTFAALLSALETAGRSTFVVGPALLNDAQQRERSARRFPTIANALFNWRYCQVFPTSRNHDMRQFLMLDHDLASSFSCDWLSGAFLLCRTSDFRDLGGFDAGYFLYYEDVDLCQRARQRGLDALFVGDTAAHHSIGASSKGISVRAGWWRVRGFIRYYRKFLRRGLGSDVCFALLLLAGLGLELLFRARRRPRSS